MDEYSGARLQVRLALTAIILKKRPASKPIEQFVESLQRKFCEYKAKVDYSQNSQGNPYFDSGSQDSGFGGSCDPATQDSGFGNSVCSQASLFNCSQIDLPLHSQEISSQIEIAKQGCENDDDDLDATIEEEEPNLEDEGPIALVDDAQDECAQQCAPIVAAQAQVGSSTDASNVQLINHIALHINSQNPLYSAACDSPLDASFSSTLSNDSVEDTVKTRKRKCVRDHESQNANAKGRRKIAPSSQATQSQSQGGAASQSSRKPTTMQIDLEWENGVDVLIGLCNKAEVTPMGDIETIVADRLKAIEKHLCSKSNRGSFARRALVSDTVQLVLGILEDAGEKSEALGGSVAYLFGKVLAHWMHQISTGQSTHETNGYTETIDSLHEILNTVSSKDTLLSVTHCTTALQLEHNTWAVSNAFNMHSYAHVECHLLQLLTNANLRLKHVLGPQRAFKARCKKKKTKFW